MKHFALLLALALVAQADEPVTPPPGTADAFRQFANIIDALEKHYIAPRQLRLPERASAAFRGFVRSLDPEADLLSADQVEEAKSPPEGDIGLTLATRGGAIVVVSARDGSPAQNAGLFTGDELVVPAGARLSDVRAQLRGSAFSPVKVQVRDGREIILPRIATATNVPPSQLKFLQPGIAYCRLAEFTDWTRTRVELDLTRAFHERATGLILDLRNNPGGSFDAMLNTARLFLPVRTVIVALDYAKSQRRAVFTSDPSQKFFTPVVLLVNGGTAAEAEIFAAALRDNHRARLVGSVTFGRGLHYGLFPLRDGSALSLPTARYLSPSKQSFEGTGLTPDVVVDVSRTVERDLARAGFGSFDWINDRAEVLKTDRTLARALELLAP